MLHTCQLHELPRVSCCLLLSGGLSQGYKGALHAASLDATMWAEGNASSCIEAATCLPLGSLPINIFHSVSSSRVERLQAAQSCENLMLRPALVECVSCTMRLSNAES